MNTPISIHPNNPKLFLFRGKPLVLLTATEHYGAVLNRPFNIARYLADAAANNMTLTRLFMLFREQQGSINPVSTCKPESTDYISPFYRGCEGLAADRLPRYDLDRWNPEFFQRLHTFLGLASEYGIIVEVTLLSNTYLESGWSLNPLYHQNNINGLPQIPWPEYMSLRHPRLVEYQLKHVAKIVQEVNRYDNVIIEVCNEPGGFRQHASYPTPDEVDTWQTRIIEVIRETESALPNKHLIAGQEAFTYDPFRQTSDKSFRQMGFDVVNMHPLPGTIYDGIEYHQGNFMSAEMNLAAVRDYALATYNEPKPLNYDEDNCASRFRDLMGWTIHRKRAWVTLLSGGHYDMIDFSIQPYLETGTPESSRYLRTWFGNLSRFMHCLDLVNSRPIEQLLLEQPEHTLTLCYGIAGSDLVIYLADARERDAGVGSPISGSVRLPLEPGDYRVFCYSPVTGMSSPGVWITAGETPVDLAVPEFEHDIVLRIVRKHQPHSLPVDERDAGQVDLKVGIFVQPAGGGGVSRVDNALTQSSIVAAGA
ncbi:MAG: cellulase family glycosylhydrolase [Chloroflexi bacterium]|nr:cellulase family glycosylhydrolase [Chloroflexota bacterium]